MHYDHKNTALARQLRKDMTPWERKLWHCFLKEYPIRFQRQKIIDSFVVDFFCAKAALIIELDGGGHYFPEKQEEDKIRTEKIEAFGYKVIRFSNGEINKNFYGVCSVIDKEVKNRTLPLSPKDDSPLKEGVKAPQN